MNPACDAAIGWGSRTDIAQMAEAAYNAKHQTRGGAVWQLVGLITRRSQVQILSPQPDSKAADSVQVQRPFHLCLPAPAAPEAPQSPSPSPQRPRSSPVEDMSAECGEIHDHC